MRQTEKVPQVSSAASALQIDAKDYRTCKNSKTV